jgi:hypothetical protein
MLMEAESAKWKLWAYDYFDQNAERVVDAEGVGLLNGLELLWSRTLEEGILDDGRPTFTWFDLEAVAGPSKIENQKSKTVVSIPRNPMQNPEMARIRDWRHEPDLIPTLARIHLKLAERGGAESLISFVRSSSTTAELLQALNAA